MTFDLLTLKVVSESCVTWATSVPILVFLGLSVLDLGPMYVTHVRRRPTDRRQTDVRHASSLGRGHNNNNSLNEVYLLLTYARRLPWSAGC